MRSLSGPRLALLALALAAGCGGTTTNATASDSGAATDSLTTPTSTDGTTTGSASASESGSETDGTGSASMTSLPTTDDPTPTSTTNPASTTETSTTGPDDTSTTQPEDTSTTDAITTDTSTTGPDCVPSEEVCNHLDDDCNGVVDDIDVGGDGICDCLSIALFGNKGANPSSQFQAWLEAQGTQVDRISLSNEPITQELLDQYDIIILDWLLRTFTPEEAALLEAWVKGGGGLMSLTGHTNNNTVVERPNSLIAPMGLSYNSSAGFFNGPVTQWTQHPITNLVTSVSFYGGLFINVVDDGIGQNTVIGTLPPGPVAVAQERQDGKLFVFGDEWITFDSEWQQIPQIQQFWVNVLGWLSPLNYCTIPQ